MTFEIFIYENLMAICGMGIRGLGILNFLEIWNRYTYWVEIR
jgi:hypothetical protein